MKLFHVYFPSRLIVLGFSDALLICVALLASICTWFGADTTLALTYEHGLTKLIVASSVCMACMYYYDLYASFVIYNRGEILTRLLQVLGTVCLVLVLLYHVCPSVQLSRGPFVIWLAVAGLSLATWRNLFYSLNNSARLRQRVVFLGDSPLMPELSKEIACRPELGLKVVGYLEPSCSLVYNNSGVPRLGSQEGLVTAIEQWRVHRIILTLRDRRRILPIRELLELKRRGTLIEDAPDVFEAITGRVHLDSLLPGRLLFSEGFRISWRMLVCKRIASVVVSILGLMISLPVMFLIALTIRLDSDGPVIFRQRRIGKNGTEFTLYKFRSMKHGSDSNGTPRPAREHDDRFTRVGCWLRKSRLDELPQLYNILRGDMYLVGPRPFARDMERELAERIPYYSERWAVKPGATGWAQIHRGYCTSLEDNAEKLGYDLFYLKNLSIGLDMLIVFETIKICLLGRGSR